MSVTVQQLQYYRMVGYRVVEADRYPEWKPAVDFKAKLDACLESVGFRSPK